MLNRRLWSTHREVYERHSQQHREEDGQPHRHHHDVPRHVGIVTEQQLRVHMSYNQETSRVREVVASLMKQLEQMLYLKSVQDNGVLF